MTVAAVVRSFVLGIVVIFITLRTHHGFVFCTKSSPYTVVPNVFSSLSPSPSLCVAVFYDFLFLTLYQCLIPVSDAHHLYCVN